MLKLSFFIFLLIATTGCRTTYIGIDSINMWSDVCEFDEPECRYSFTNLNIAYKLSSPKPGFYSMQGKIYVNESPETELVKEQLEKIKLTFIYLDNYSVVEEQSIYVYNEITRSHDFNIQFTSAADIIFSKPIEYRATIAD